MSRISRFPLSCLFALVLFSALPKQAEASHRSPLYCAAEQYREAVRDFERLVLRTRYIDRCDERLVDDLEDSTSRLRSAARDPRRYDRLCQRYAETKTLHIGVESVFFGIGKYPLNPQLEICWSLVANTYAVLVEQMSCVSSGHGHHPTACSVGVPLVSHSRIARQVGVSVSQPISSYRPELYDLDRYADQYGPRPVPSTQRALPSPSGGNPPGFTRQTISTRDELRRAVIGAMLQRIER